MLARTQDTDTLIHKFEKIGGHNTLGTPFETIYVWYKMNKNMG